MKQILFVLVLWSGLCVSAAAQDVSASALETKAVETVNLAKGTQTDLDDWSQERQALDVRYRTAQANLKYLRERLARKDEKSAALDGKVAELRRRLTESVRMQEVIQDTMNVVLGQLTTTVAEDLPFFPVEREQRLANLRTAMASPDLAPAEKLRLLLEALLVEAQYGETVDVEPATIVVADHGMHVDVLRIGRLVMYWRSPDGSRVGTWDPATGAWVELPSKYKRVIARTMEMASRIRPTELVSLPLGRISR